MSNLTFGAWLIGQEHRPAGDSIGELARHWKAVKGDKKIRSKPGVETALRAAGDFEPASPVLGWWADAEAAWNSLQGGPAAGDGAHLSAVPDPPQEQAQPPLDYGQLEAQAARLAGGTGLVPYQARLTGSGTDDLVRIYEEVTGQVWEDPPSQLDRMEAKLDWLHMAVLGQGIKELPAWPAYPPAPRIDWRERFETADFDAQQA